MRSVSALSLVALAIGMGLSRSGPTGPPQLCYRFDKPYFEYARALYQDIASTDVIALEQGQDTTAGQPLGAPDDAEAVEAPLMMATTFTASEILDRSWWRRATGDSIEIRWNDGRLVFHLAVRDDSLTGVAHSGGGNGPISNLPATAVRLACPVAVHRPASGNEGLDSFDDDGRWVIDYFLDWTNLMGAVVWRGVGIKDTLSVAERARDRQVSDSLIELAHSRGRGYSIMGKARMEYSLDERTMYIEGQAFRVPDRRALLVVLVDLRDSVDGRPRIETRRIKYTNGLYPSKSRTRPGQSDADADVFERVLRLDSVVRAFLDRR